MSGQRIELSAVGTTLRTEYMARETDRRTLHTQAQTKKRNVPCASILACSDLAFDTAWTKSTRHDDTLCTFKQYVWTIALNMFG